MYGTKSESEVRLALTMIPRLPANSLLMADRGFGEFGFVWASIASGRDVVAPGKPISLDGWPSDCRPSRRSETRSVPLETCPSTRRNVAGRRMCGGPSARVHGPLGPDALSDHDASRGDLQRRLEPTICPLDRHPPVEEDTGNGHAPQSVRRGGDEGAGDWYDRVQSGRPSSDLGCRESEGVAPATQPDRREKSGDAPAPQTPQQLTATEWWCGVSPPWSWRHSASDGTPYHSWTCGSKSALSVSCARRTSVDNPDSLFTTASEVATSLLSRTMSFFRMVATLRLTSGMTASRSRRKPKSPQ